MDTNLQPIATALADLADTDLRGLVEASNDVEQIAPGLLAWLDTACVWQLQQRDGYDFELQPPEAAIPPEEDPISVDAAIALRDAFAHDTPAVGALFDSLLELLTRVDERKH